MKRIHNRAVVTMAFAATLAGTAPVGASHESEVDDGELRCQQNASTAVTRFMNAKTQCLIGCWTAVRRGDPRDCRDTFQDGDPRDAETQACIDRAEGRALDRYARSCPPAACPECREYGGCGGDGQEKLDTAEAVVDVVDQLVHCDDLASGDGSTGSELACQDAIAATLARLPAALARCTNGCLRSAHRGAPRACEPDGRDAELTACLAAAEERCVERIAAGCADFPECLGQGSIAASLCNFVADLFAGQYGEYYCSE
jgi:hypothetical protein